MHTQDWGPQSLEELSAARRGPRTEDLPVRAGMVLEELETGWVGAAVRLETIGGQRVVSLEDRHGAVRAFPLGYGFLYEGRPVRLVPPASRPQWRRPDPVGLGRPPPGPGPHGAGLADAGRGGARRRAGGEGLGR